MPGRGCYTESPLHPLVMLHYVTPSKAQMRRKEQGAMTTQDLADRLERSIERGGLPTEEDAEQAYKALRQAYDRLEGLAFRVKPFAAADSSDIDEPITLEQLGLVALIAADARRSLDDIGKEVAHLESAIWELGAIRDDQINQIRMQAGRSTCDAN